MRFLIDIFRKKNPRLYWAIYWYLIQLNLYKRFSFCSDLLLSLIIKENDTVIDVGSNIGQFTLSMAYLTGSSGSVHAFEPYSQSFGILSNRIAHAKLNSVIKLNKIALSNNSGTVTLTIPKGKCTEATLMPHKTQSWTNYELNPEAYTTEKCKLTTLDSYIKENSIKNISLIKCDVEGAELCVLMGAENILKGPNPPILLIEIFEEWTKSFGYLPKDIFSYLKKIAGYEFYWLHEKGLQKVNPDSSVFPGVYWQYLDYLCIVPGIHNDKLKLKHFFKNKR